MGSEMCIRDSSGAALYAAAWATTSARIVALSIFVSAGACVGESSDELQKATSSTSPPHNQRNLKSHPFFFYGGRGAAASP